MLATYPNDARARGAAGRHAADEVALPPAVPPPAWWRRMLPRAGHDLAVETGHTVVRVDGPLDDATAARLDDCVRRGQGLRLHEVVVVHLGACDFVNVRGFRALLRLQDEALLHTGRMVVIDPPRTLRIMCRAVPGRLTLAPDDAP